MQPYWSKRFWEKFVDEDYATIPIEVVKEMIWLKIASQRYWSDTGKWFGY